MVTICPKCGKRAWKPYKFVIRGNGGKKYTYLVYRHNEKKRHTPRKCYVARGKQARSRAGKRFARSSKRGRKSTSSKRRK